MNDHQKAPSLEQALGCLALMFVALTVLAVIVKVLAHVFNFQ